MTMTKVYAMHLVLGFGRDEEHTLIAAGKHTEAYQIEHARQQMAYALLDSIKCLRTRLDEMTRLEIGEDEVWQYNPYYFVSDGYVRELVENFKANFGGANNV